MTTLARPRRLNNIENLRPGMEGSVGDALLAIQLKKSAPESALRFDQVVDRPDDGSLLSSQPYTYDSSWNMGRSENFAYGLMQQDLRAPDKLHEPTLGAIPQYQWRNKIATVYEAKRTGFKFLPVPGEYQLAQGEMVRGGQVVRKTDVEGLYSVVENQQPSPSIGLARQNDAMANFIGANKGYKLGQKPQSSLQSGPIVRNTPRPSLSSTSANFRLMDPNSVVTPPSLIASSGGSSLFRADSPLSTPSSNGVPIIGAPPTVPKWRKK